MKPPKIIYLIKPDIEESDLEWCTETGINPQDATRYIRSDHVFEVLKDYKKVTALMDELEK